MIEAINNLPSPWKYIAWAGAAAFALLIAWLLAKLNKLIFKRIQKKHKGLNLIFFQHFISGLIFVGFLVLAVSSFAGFETVWRTVLGGTAVLSAVIAFVAQDIIRDILAGLMLSLHHPFEVGDRIVLEDGMSGIVEDVTLRHVVLKGVDTVRHVIPNSKINAVKLTNLSYKRDNRSVEFNFSIGYGSDMSLAKSVIEKTIEKSKYSIPGMTDAKGRHEYAKAYFMRFADSALILHATVYYEKTTPTEKLIDDINVSVREALIQNGIEIPYSYVNVVTHDAEPAEKADATEKSVAKK